MLQFKYQSKIIWKHQVICIIADRDADLNIDYAMVWKLHDIDCTTFVIVISREKMKLPHFNLHNLELNRFESIHL